MSAPATSGLLAGRVAVISGVGPGLGRSIALRMSAAGARVVLAARSRDRLEHIAAEIEKAGGNALAVPTDITDDAAVTRLAATVADQCGRVDILVNNAFALPSMKPLEGTDLDAIAAGVDLTVLGTLRVIRAFTDPLTVSAAERADGSAVVNINSMVIRHSEPRYGSYKIAKAALHAMSHTLASELGDKGIRVNSVAPGYIWDDQLKRYFGAVATKYGIPADDVYAQTAARSDLKRLPEPDEIADAAVFLASPMASAITGQTLDVNCGEYHD